MAATLSTRLLVTAPATVLAMLVTALASPAAAGTAAALGKPTVVLELPQAEYFEGAGPVIPKVRLTNATLIATGTYTFFRYADPRCQGPRTELGAKAVKADPVEGPNVNHGELGRFGIGVTYSGDLVNEPASACVPYALLRKSEVRASLAKQTFDSDEEIKPAVTLAGTTGQPTGAVEFRRFAGSATCEGTAVPVGSAQVNGSSVAQSVNLQNGAMGAQSYRVHYSGDEANAPALSECVSYTVGAFIRGRVFSDLDNDGLAGAGEPGIADVGLVLKKDSQPVAEAKTNDKGEYEFFVTTGGSYLLVQTQPDGFTSSTVDERTVSVTGTAVLAQDFGESLIEAAQPTSAAAQPSLVDAGTDAQDAEPLSLTTGWIRLIVISLVVIGLLAVLVLAIAARNRRYDEELERTRVDLDQTRRR